jgi:hypothetical protein
MKVHRVTFQNTIIIKAENTISGVYINILNITITSEAKDIQTFFYIINIQGVKLSEETERER